MQALARNCHKIHKIMIFVEFREQKKQQQRMNDLEEEADFMTRKIEQKVMEQVFQCTFMHFLNLTGLNKVHVHVYIKSKGARPHGHHDV